MKKLFATSDIDTYNKILDLLGYKETKRESIPLSKISIVTYKKEKEVDNYLSLKDRYMPLSTIPFFMVVFFVIVAVTLATTFLILNLVDKELDKLFYFYTLMLPTSISTLVATGISYYRYFVELKNIERVSAIPLLKKEIESHVDHN